MAAKDYEGRAHSVGMIMGLGSQPRTRSPALLTDIFVSRAVSIQ